MGRSCPVNLNLRSGCPPPRGATRGAVCGRTVPAHGEPIYTQDQSRMLHDSPLKMHILSHYYCCASLVRTTVLIDHAHVRTLPSVSGPPNSLDGGSTSDCGQIFSNLSSRLPSPVGVLRPALRIPSCPADRLAEDTVLAGGGPNREARQSVCPPAIIPAVGHRGGCRLMRGRASPRCGERCGVALGCTVIEWSRLSVGTAAPWGERLLPKRNAWQGGDIGPAPGRR